MSGDPLVAQIGIVREGGGKGPNIPEGLRQEIRGGEERIERADWESVKKRTDWNLQVIKWLVH